MKKKITIVMAVLLLLTLCSCGKEKTMGGGYYSLTGFRYEGWNMPELWEESFIFVSGVDNNSISSLNLFMDMSDGLSLDTLSGYIETVGTTSNYIQYRFWIVSHTGEIFKDNTDYLTWRYYPDSKKIEIDGKNDMAWIFEKE